MVESLLIIIIPFSVLTIITAALVLITEEKFEKCLVFSLLLITLVLYYTQFIFHTFKYGMIILIIIPCAVIIMKIIKIAGAWYKIHESKEKFVARFFSPGFFVFIVLTVLIIFIDYNRQITYWDEYSHWGMMTKELLRLDTFYSDKTISRLLVHWEYPPFAPLFQMFWCSLSGGFTEMGCFIATHIFSIALIVPFFSISSHDEGNSFQTIIRKFFLLIGCILIVIFMDPASVFFTLLQDIFFTLLYVYAMILILDGTVYKKLFDVFTMFMISVALPLTKEMGIAFVLVLWLYYILKFFFRITKLRFSVLQNVISMLLVMGGTFFSVFLWNQYVDKLEVMDRQFSLSNISLQIVLDVVNGLSSEQIRIDTLHSYIRALFEVNITNSLVPLSFISCTVLVIVLLVVLWLAEYKHSGEKNAFLLAVSFSCGTIGWIFTMGILYMFCFTESEMLGLASYTRYMSPWILSELLVLAVAIQRLLYLRHIKLRYIILTCTGMFIVLCSCDFTVFRPAFTKNVSHQSERIRAKMIESLTVGAEQVLLIQHDTIRTQYATNFFSEDVRYTLNYTDLLGLDYTSEGVKESVIKLFAEQDYICFVNMEDVVNEVIAKEIYGGAEIWMGYLYRVNHNEDGTIFIERVN
ncbi:MAG: hypothetical protein HFH84_18990 [Lachnospiraceae bacterium]|nr:hypothetical protein [Lachnospiraceae bacterium]